MGRAAYQAGRQHPRPRALPRSIRRFRSESRAATSCKAKYATRSVRATATTPLSAVFMAVSTLVSLKNYGVCEKCETFQESMPRARLSSTFALWFYVLRSRLNYVPSASPCWAWPLALGFSDLALSTSSRSRSTLYGHYYLLFVTGCPLSVSAVGVACRCRERRERDFPKLC